MAKNKPAPEAEALPEATAPSVPLESRVEVLGLLRELSNEDRSVVVMAFVEGRSQKEIGKVLGWSRQTINKRVNALRDRAVHQLGGSHDD